jgi:hypothetical protein
MVEGERVQLTKIVRPEGNYMILQRTQQERNAAAAIHIINFAGRDKI